MVLKKVFLRRNFDFYFKFPFLATHASTKKDKSTSDKFICSSGSQKCCEFVLQTSNRRTSTRFLFFTFDLLLYKHNSRRLHNCTSHNNFKGATSTIAVETLHHRNHYNHYTKTTATTTTPTQPPQPLHQHNHRNHYTNTTTTITTPTQPPEPLHQHNRHNHYTNTTTTTPTQTPQLLSQNKNENKNNNQTTTKTQTKQHQQNNTKKTKKQNQRQQNNTNNNYYYNEDNNNNTSTIHDSASHLSTHARPLVQHY